MCIRGISGRICKKDRVSENSEGKEWPMITKEILKAKIDNIPDQYLEAAYRITKAFEHIPLTNQNAGADDFTENQEWLSFIEKTYGCLADDPIERGNKGEFENRE
jgi:hypothetical protein